ncbi:MAG: hypothetical protein AAF281_12580 [Pseudomonadota bacterium]
MPLPHFLLSSLWIGIWVMLHMIPVVLLISLAIVGPLFATDNIWVQGIVGLIAGTVGVAFYAVSGVRAGLAALRQTDTPDFDGLVKATVKIMFIFAILQFVAVLIGVAGLTALFQMLIAPDVAALTPAGLPDFRGFLQALFGDAFGAGLDPSALSGTALLFLGCVFVIVAAVAGLSGVPMAASGANAVRHSPRHDLIFGFGGSFLGIFAVTFLSLVASTAVSSLTPTPTIGDATLHESLFPAIDAAPPAGDLAPATSEGELAPDTVTDVGAAAPGIAGPRNDAAGKTVTVDNLRPETEAETTPEIAPSAQTEPVTDLSAGPEVPALSMVEVTTLLALALPSFLAQFYLQCTIFAAFALGYQDRVGAVRAARKAERMPAYDPTNHVEEVRSLRQRRQQSGRDTAVYVPERYRSKGADSDSAGGSDAGGDGGGGA